ncbi:MAG: malto-oligosyltrehalose synthase [Isosphaeraceae bacterium]
MATVEPLRPGSAPIDRTPYVEELLAAAIEEIARRRAVPDSTYRLQLHAGFRFGDVAAIVPYLARLGITDCYASPYLKAAPGSTHGYDITDHGQLNPEIGTPEDHGAWLKSLQEHGLGLVLDVVPNHMGILGNENPWWNDVLENGQASVYSRFFDIDWSAPVRPENRGRVLLPFLGDLYGVILEKGELQVTREGGSFLVQYHDHRYPLDPKSYGVVLEPVVDPISGVLGAEHPAVLEFQSVLTAVRNLPDHTERRRDRVLERNREKEVIKRRLATLVTDHPEFDSAIQGSITKLNGKEGDPRSFDALDELLAAQPYRLAFWRVAPDEINYRRFFDVNTLAALRTDREEVFQATHATILEILARGDVTGLRIDHPDGLLDPQGYLERLQEAFVLAVARRLHEEAVTAEVVPWDEILPILREQLALRGQAGERMPRLYVVVEKILGFDESFPEGWLTHGTSGYDALNRINGVFVDTAAAEAFIRRYQDWVGDQTPYREVVRRNKQLILDVSLASELHVLAYQLERIALRDRRSRDFTQSGLRHALREVIASFPVYRSYITSRTVTDQDKALVDRAIRSAMRRNPVTSRSVFRFLRNVLLDRLTTPEHLPEEEFSPSEFAGKFQQVTAPVMAKGLEDTTFYVYNRLVSLNEVGGEPVRFGLTPVQLHAWNGERAVRYPHALTPLSTHDTKRSEDVRARINVLSEMPDSWFAAVDRWSELNRPHRKTIEERDAPSRNEEYFLYQNLLGAWPVGELDDQALESFRERFRGFMAKAVHEAKVNSSWLNPNPEYDEAIDQFVVAILDRGANRAFLDDFLSFQAAVSHHGFLNSLSQTLLKLAGPGAPDTYQGTELWDFSLVDPDNRRPVDYGLRLMLLNDLATWYDDPGTGPTGLARNLIGDLEDGRIKLYTHWRALAARKEFPALFSSGEYRPIVPRGPRADHVFAFSRRDGSDLAIVAVPRLTSKFVKPGVFPIGTEVWGDTDLELTGTAPGTEFRSIFCGSAARTEQRGDAVVVRAVDLFAAFPVALFIGRA